ncbi:MAG: hypothetical protein K6U79_11365 [Firmicutes bacterium]|nr:hypothetical protein [Bacillota bacterium]
MSGALVTVIAAGALVEAGWILQVTETERQHPARRPAWALLGLAVLLLLTQIL